MVCLSDRSGFRTGAIIAQHKAICKFFLGTGCREQEVSHAEWSDIDWQRHTFTVKAKPRWGFTPKSHEARAIPLPAELLLNVLKEYLAGSESHAPHVRAAVDAAFSF